MAKISLNSHVNTFSGDSWTLQTIYNIKYFVSTNKTASSVSAIKCSFTTPYDNIDVVVEIGSSSESNYDWCYVGKLDDSGATYNNYLDRISGVGSNNAPIFKQITINVPKAGDHFLIIGYRKDSSGNNGNDCGYFRIITTEVEKQKNSYIYCGTKKKLEPIEFSKDDASNSGFAPYTGSDERLQWGNKYAGNNSSRSSRISFMTTSDNTTVTLIYERYFNANGDKFVVSSIDGALTFTKNDYVYIAGAGEGVITKEITVSKAGKHYIDIGYVLINPRSHIRVGFSGSNIILNPATPESILANNKDISEVYVGSELIWEKSKYLWSNQEYLYNISFYNKISNSKVTWGSKKHDKYIKERRIIPGGTDFYTKTTYGFGVDDLVKNGYLFIDNYQNSTDISSFPNPVNMDTRYNTSNGGNNIKFLKINPKLNKETTSLNGAFRFIGSSNHDEFSEPLIYEHKACNIVGLNKLNTTNITNMTDMFYRSRIVGNLDFSNWDTSKVTNMSYMFDNMKGLNRNKNTNKYLLENYSYLTGLNNWDLKSAQDMHYMFMDSTYYDFQDKELTWNTYNVTDMSYMFAYASTYHFPKLSFDTRNVTNMAYMFTGFESYNDLKLNFTDTSKVKNTSGMFGNSMDIPHNKYNFSYFNYHGNADISCLDTSNVVNANNMFRSCIYLTPDKIKNIRLPKATEIPNMFLGCYMGGWDFINQNNTYIDTIDLSNLDLGSINGPYFSPIRHAFAFGGFRNSHFTGTELIYDDYPINTYINNLILDNWKCFANYSSDIKMTLDDSPFYGCQVTYCYMRGCNSNTKAKIKQMLGLNTYNSTYASCSYFIED